MQANTGSAHTNAAKNDRLEVLLRQEESKLLDLLSAVARKNGEAFDPNIKQEHKKTRNESVLIKERAGSIRPGISQVQRENNYSKNAITELQTLLNQTILDMKVLREEKDFEISELHNAMKKMEDEMESIRDRGISVSHYSNLFISSTLTGIERGNITCTPSNQAFLIKLAESTIALIKSSQFLEDGNIFNTAEISQKRPSNRRSSLNLVPFSRADSEMIYEENSEEGGDQRGASSGQETHRLIQMPETLEGAIELLFITFSTIKHSRDNKLEEGSSVPLLSDMYLTKRNFLAMCLTLDIIDGRLTLSAAKSCFEKYAFISERGQKKFNNRLTVNSFVECLMNMALFKFPEVEPNSATAIQRIVDSMHFGSLLENESVLRGLFDMFFDLCHPGVIDKFALNQVLLLKSYKRSANYGVTSTLTSSRDNHMSGAALVKSFNQFCSSYKIVPILTRESVITRISMYMSSYSDDGVRFLMGCLITLCIALSRSDDDTDITSFPNIGIINAALERILLQVEAHL